MKGIAISELIFIILLAGGFLIPPVIAGQWFLFGVFMIFFVCFGMMEWWASSVGSKKTISQRFWELKKKSKGKALAVIIGMAVAWLALLWHLWIG